MIARRSLLRMLVSLWVVVGGLLFVWSAPALAQRKHVFSFTFGSPGSGAGELTQPAALAVSEETGDVYVIDRGNSRVEIFNGSTGAYIGQFNGSASPTGVFSFTGEAGQAPQGSIAVDNSKNPLDPSKGDVYVLDFGHSVIDKFSPSGAYIGQIVGTSPTSPFVANGEDFDRISAVAVDSNGTLWVQRGRPNGVDEFNDALINGYVSSMELGFPIARESSASRPQLGQRGFALDSEDNIYIGEKFTLEEGPTTSAKFSDMGEILAEELDGREVATGFAVDLSSNDAYIDHETSVAAFSPSGFLVERFGSVQMHASTGIAVSSSTGTVYTSDASSQEIDAFTAVVVPDAKTEPASSFAETSATVNGVVNPDGLPVAECVFEYGTSEAYGQSASCSTSPGSGSSPVAVSAQLTGLERLTRYHFRLKVSNANGSNEGQDRTFVTPEPVGISEESVVDVSSDSAVFSAQVDPSGADTTYAFEYGTTASYGKSAPAPAGNLGAGTSSAPATVSAQDLTPGTTYHVRIVASNLLGTVFGPDETFTTQAGGGAFVLPDGREWELVSPPSKYGASIYPFGDGYIVEASEDGSAISYGTSGPVVANPAGNPSPEGRTQVLSQRGVDGWSTEDIDTPHQATTSAEGGQGLEYLLFSSDLSQGLVEPEGDTLLSPEATGKTVYVHDFASGSYVPLVTTTDVNAPPGTVFGNDEHIEGIDATPDLSHVLLFSAHVALTSNAISQGEGLYEWSGRRLQLVNVLPDGMATKRGRPGENLANIRHAMSNDGSRVFWKEGQGPEGGPLYMRNTVTEQTVQVDAPAPGVTAPPAYKPQFEIASADGSMVFFLDEEPLTLDSKLTPVASGHTIGTSDLYMYDTATGALTDLSVDHNADEQAEVQNMVVGASEDGSVVYFVAKGVLAEGAESGKDNLYVESEAGSAWSTRFVAVLSEDDDEDWAGEKEASGDDPVWMTSRVSPNGRYLAFMSDRSLTGYDNRDANSGQPDDEVFLYDEATSRLACVSCNPTGVRPDGVFDPGRVEGEGPGRGQELLVDPEGRMLQGKWLAASLPGWEQILGGGNQYGATYQPRYLSDEGRLFFNSADALVPQATNGREDVYEYEPVGAGRPSGCTTAAAGYVADRGGCVSLVSAGTSPEESAFMDASENGNDVFFLTAARLTSQDVDTAFDVYDAHVCSESSPCVSQPVLPPPCASGDACKAAPSPQPAIFGAPASATFSGAGNVTQGSPVKSASTPKKGSKKKKAKKRSSRAKPKSKSKSKSKGLRARKSLSTRTRR
jgi:hypothetical protein